MKSAHEPPTSSEVDLRRARWLSRRWSMSYQGNEYLNADGYNVVIFPWYDRGAAGWRTAITRIPNGVTSFSKYKYPTADAAKRAASVEIFVPEETVTAMTIPEHNRPLTFHDIEASLHNGRLLPWANAIPGFWNLTPGERALIALQFLQRFLPTRDEIDALEADGLFPDAIEVLIVHLIEHLNKRQPLSRPCAICKPLEGLRVGLSGEGKIGVWQTDADGKIQPGDRSPSWHCANLSSPAALEGLKQRILEGDGAVAAKEISNG